MCACGGGAGGEGQLRSLKGLGSSLYWIPKATGATEGLNPFASWGKSSALLGTETLAEALSPVYHHSGWDSVAPHGDPDASGTRGHLA